MGFAIFSATRAVAVVLVASILGVAPAWSADLVIRNVVVTDVRAGRFVPAQDIFVDGGKITRIAPTGSWKEPVDREIDGSDMIATPGFVNTHTHLWQHVARSVAPQSSLQRWAGAVYASAHYATGDDIKTLTDAAAGEALLGGTTTVADFASVNFRDDGTAGVLSALKDNNIDGGVVWWRQAVFLPSALQDRQIGELKAAGAGRLQVLMGFGPMSFMSLPSVYDGVLSAKRNGLRMTEHEMENLAEARDFQKRIGDYWKSVRDGQDLEQRDRDLLRPIVTRKPISAVDGYLALARRADRLLTDPNTRDLLTDTEKQALGAVSGFDAPSPLPLLDDWGALNGFLSIHSVWPTKADIELLSARGASVSHNPESNMYLTSGVAPVVGYLEAKVPVTLGTDGAASNDRISMFDAIRTAALLQKVSELSTLSTAKLDAWFWLRAATINGAEALGLGGSTGSLDVGKDADILLVDRRRLGAAPMLKRTVDGVLVDTTADLLVNSVSGRDLAFVIANGKIMVDQGRLADEARRAKALQAVAERLWSETEKGAPWRETIPVRAEMGKQGWWRYRSVRAKDAIEVRVANGGDAPVRVVLAFSGTTFGGQSAPTLSPEALKRYPLQAPPGYGAWTIALKPGEVFTVVRPSGGAAYRLGLPSGEVSRSSVAAEQVMLYVADGVDMP